MEDFWYLLAMVAFVAVAALFVVACDKLIGPDEDALADQRRDDDRPERAKAAA